MRLIPLELQPTDSASRRKAREVFLIYRGKTLSPEGINRKNERWTFDYTLLYFCYLIIRSTLSYIFLQYSSGPEED